MYTPTDNDIKKLETAFTYHSPKADQPERYQQIRGQARTLASLLMELCPPSRELSLALTNLEQAAMWANAAIARNES